MLSRERERTVKCMERKSDAISRTKLQNELIAAGTKRPRCSVGPTSSYTIEDLDGCLEKVRGLKRNNELVIFDKLAREHKLKNKKGIIPDNCGQVLKKMMTENDIDPNDLKTNCNGPRTRKKYKRVYREVTVPVEPNKRKIKEKLDEEIDQGKYSYGESIIPQEFKKLTVIEDDDGSKEIVETTFEISGRKFAIDLVRQRINERVEKYLRIQPDKYFEDMTNEQLKSEMTRLNMRFCEKHPRKRMLRMLEMFNRQRFIICWHDTSPIVGSSHFLVTLSCVYDQALFYLDDEYYEKTGERTSVQANVEYPEVYILARCPATDQQLMYGDLRLEDIEELSTMPVMLKGVQVNDHFRFFKGDAPACQLEGTKREVTTFVGAVRCMLKEGTTLHMFLEEKVWTSKIGYINLIYQATCELASKTTRRTCSTRSRKMKLDQNFPCVVLSF
uniref:Uncharacterized protein n=1 Tax=Clytia hemisphaerica TaxID=252671 RepID=A0A7M5X6F1_9CNID